MNIPMLFPKDVATKDVSAVWKTFMGIPQGEGDMPRTLRDFAQQPADEAWVYRCMAVRAEAAQGIPLVVQIRDGKEWVPAEGRDDPAADALQFLLDDVNPAWHGALLQAYMEAGSVIHGGSYLRKVRGRLGGYPQELWWLSGADIQPQIPPTGSLPTSYRYQTMSAAPVDYDARDIIPLRETVNLQSPYQLLSPLSSARFEISVNRQAAEWNASVLRNWSIPPMAWIQPVQTSANPPLAPTELNAIRRALRALRGPSQQGKVPIIPGGLEPKSLALTQKDADWIASRKISRMAICAVLGVPLPLAGDDEKNSVYAVVRDAERVMWRMTLIPKLDARAAALNSWLTPEFDPTRKRLRLAYDYSGIEALQPAPAEAMAAWATAVDHGLPFNRYIARFGLGQPVQGGDEARVYLRTGEMPLVDQGAVANIAATGKPAPAAEPANPRPENYNTAAQAGNESPAKSIAALGRGLYKHSAVKDFIATGNADVLAALVEPADVPTFAEGIRRRESAEQIAARFLEIAA